MIMYDSAINTIFLFVIIVKWLSSFKILPVEVGIILTYGIYSKKVPNLFHAAAMTNTLAAYHTDLCTMM